MASNVVTPLSNELKNQVSNQFESAISDILPELYQLFQRYQVSSPLEIHLFDLADDLFPNSNSCVCCGIVQRPCNCRCLSSDLPGLDPEKTQQFCIDFDSILSTILPRLSQAAKQIDESFEVQFLLNPATAKSGQPLTSQWIGDSILECSN